MRKDTKIISEIGIFFKKSAENKAIYSIMDVISSVRLQERQIGIQKNANCKFSVLHIFHLLLLFPFFSVKNIYHFADSGLSQMFSAEKDVFYRFLSNDNIRWRDILMPSIDSLSPSLRSGRIPKEVKLPSASLPTTATIPRPASIRN